MGAHVQSQERSLKLKAKLRLVAISMALEAVQWELVTKAASGHRGRRLGPETSSLPVSMGREARQKEKQERGPKTRDQSP